jgi:alkylation response protein AidB-like acyl-CoA dehydrogenase
MTATADPDDIATKAITLGEELLDTVTAYVKERRIRDRPLGSHQAVAHTLANHWVTTRALRAALTRHHDDHDDTDRTLAIAIGATQTLAALCDDAVRLRGGNGYLAEDPASIARHDALQLAHDLGDPDEIAEQLGRPDRHPIRTDDRHQTAVDETLAGIWNEHDASRADITGLLHDPDVHRAVTRRGWLGAFVAQARINPDLRPAEGFAIAESLTVAGIPIYALNTTAMAAALIRDHGSAHLRTTVLPTLLAGDAICALGYTEPDAGSDLAALTTTATRRNDHWDLHGTKRFCTLADDASHILVLARSDPNSHRHRGLTLFAVPAASPGITTKPLQTHGGETTSEVRLNNVAVPDTHLIGDVGNGWAVVMAAMRYERNASPWCECVRLLHRADELGSANVVGRRLSDNPGWRRHVGALYVDIIIGRGLVDELLDDNVGSPTAPSAVKLFCTEALARHARRLITSTPLSALREAAATRIESMWRRSISLTIAGGASEVQRDLIATHALGLPRPGRHE